LEVKYLEEYGIYVSDDGKVLKEVKSWEDSSGYMMVTLSNQKHRNQQIHRLVAKAFIQYDENSDGIVMHKDDNPKNNKVENLMWGTYTQNINEAYEHGLRDNNRPVMCMETGDVFLSARKAGKEMFGIPKRGDHIVQVCRSERNCAYGYHWKFATKEEVLCR